MAHAPGLGQCEAFGERVEATPELQPSQQRVDLAHLRPRQWAVEQRRRVDADRLAVASGHALQQVEVAHGVGRLVRGEIGWVGRTLPRCYAWVDLDQLALVEEAHEGPVC